MQIHTTIFVNQGLDRDGDVTKSLPCKSKALWSISITWLASNANPGDFELANMASVLPILRTPYKLMLWWQLQIMWLLIKRWYHSSFNTAIPLWDYLYSKVVKLRTSFILGVKNVYKSLTPRIWKNTLIAEMWAVTLNENNATDVLHRPKRLPPDSEYSHFLFSRPYRELSMFFVLSQ